MRPEDFDAATRAALGEVDVRAAAVVADGR
ncbi:MAG: hypothetical protein JWO67_4058, partial [Streptosporangiaceae bacterium]|nr:hypothetical protein [Streptosporangiaceae bacterium]